MTGALITISSGLQAEAKATAPEVASLREFLECHARVPMSGGAYGPFSFEGREALGEIVDTIDMVLGSHTGKPLSDAQIDICGGAQFGKTILALNTGVYLTACRWLNWGYYLPDDDLVEGIVDSKLRPDVIEQIPWLADLMTVGIAETDKGKAVNRKGAFRVSDGKRKAFGMIRGMGKIPTSFSMACTMEDEKDDIPEKNSKFLSGRMTASELRLRCSIGTQRVHGRGQQKQWADGSQGKRVFDLADGRTICLEDEWPQVCRMAVDGVPSPDDPRLDYTDRFTAANGKTWEPDPAAHYYLADPVTGEPINRRAGRYVHARTERITKRHWSWRVSQLSIDAIALSGIVSRWGNAVKDPESMAVFLCDVLAKPGNTSQGISQQIIERSRETGIPYDMSLTRAEGTRCYAGVDTGDRCWFVAREVVDSARKRVRYAERIALGDVVRRTIELCALLQPDFLAIDSRPAAAEARSIAWALCGLDGIEWPDLEDIDNSVIVLPGGVTWDGPRKTWRGIRAAVVEFSLKDGGGIEWRAGKHVEDGRTKLYPVLRASREDTISRVVSELLTPAENVMRVVEGKLLAEPVMRLPKAGPGCLPASEELARHLMVGSERDKTSGSYVDKCENHFLLANGYSSLAEEVAPGREQRVFHYEPVRESRPNFRRTGGMI